MIPHVLSTMTLRDVKAFVMQVGKNPRVHPNGFIQLDIENVEDGWHESHKEGHSGANLRLHIWNPPGIVLPRQDSVHEIHDHVFEMKSTILRGTLRQQLYEFKIGSLEHDFTTHQLYRAVYSKNSDSRLEPLGVYGVIEQWMTQVVREGDCYTQPASTFHDTETPGSLVVTVMEKTAIKAKQAHVLVPKDTEPDNDFDRASAVQPELLWEAIARSLTP